MQLLKLLACIELDKSTPPETGDSAAACTGIVWGQDPYVSVGVFYPSELTDDQHYWVGEAFRDILDEYRESSYAALRFGAKTEGTGEINIYGETDSGETPVPDASPDMIRVYFTEDAALLASSDEADGIVYLSLDFALNAEEADPASNMYPVIKAFYRELGVELSSTATDDASFSVTPEEVNAAYCNAIAFGYHVKDYSAE